MTLIHSVLRLLCEHYLDVLLGVNGRKEAVKRRESCNTEECMKKRGGPVPQPADTKVVQKSGELRPVSSGIKKSPSNTAPTKTKKK